MNIEDKPKKIYIAQTLNCMRLSLPMPEYTLDEFNEWLDNNPTWNRLYISWLFKKCPKDLTPRVYRIDSTKPYTLNNLAVSTTCEIHKRK